MSSDPGERAAAIRAGDRRALAQAITLAESTRADHRSATVALLDELARSSSDAPGASARPTLRIGISGTPGVGKSTFIERFGLHLCDTVGLRIAVLAVDPSSALTGGSILGDKTRMTELSRHTRAYIRPSPAGGNLGGVARRTREVMLLCEAAGVDVVIVETVGVGQSETAVANLTDAFVLLMAPAGGDELQGVKRGIMELADLIVVNKCDGSLESAARATAADYASALRLIRSRSAAWTPEVLLASAHTGLGVAEVWSTLERFRDEVSAASAFAARRAGQRRSWMWDEVLDRLNRLAHRADLAAGLEADVVAGRRSPSAAATELLERLGFAASENRYVSAMSTPRIDQINVVVADVVGAALFLQGLGIDVPDIPAPWDAHHRDVPAVTTSRHGGHDLAEPRFGVDLDSSAFSQQWGGLPASFNGVVLNVRLDDRHEVDELHDRALSLRGVSRKAPYDAFWGSRFALVEGPGPLYVGLMSVPSPDHRSATPDPATFA